MESLTTGRRGAAVDFQLRVRARTIDRGVEAGTPSLHRGG
jgi:hypothetical protein